MAITYEVGAAFTIVDRSSGVLNTIASTLERLDATIKNTQAALNQIGSGSMFSGLEAATRAIAAGMENVSSAVAGVTARMEAMEAAAGRASAAAASAASMAREGGGAGRGGGAMGPRPQWMGGGSESGGGGGGGALGPRPQWMGGGGGGEGGGRGGGGAMGPRPQWINTGEEESGGGRGGGGALGPRPRWMNQGEPGGGGGGGGGALGPRPSWINPPVPPTGVARRSGGGGVLAGMAPFIEAGTVYEAVHMAMSEELSIAQALFNMNIDPRSTEGKAGAGAMRSAAASAAKGTIFSERASAAGMPIVAGELGFSGGEGIEKFKQIYPVVLQMAEMAQMMNMGTMEGSLKAGVEYAHMTGRYEPKELEGGLDRLFAISRSVGQSPQAEEQILKYAVPFGKAAGIDPDQTAGVVGFLQQMGFNSTTAGTGFARVLLGLMSTEDPKGTGGRHSSERTNLMAALHEREPSGGEARQHWTNQQRGLRALGLRDEHGKSTVDDDKGHPDIMLSLSKIADAARTLTPRSFMVALKDAFNIQGERVASVLSDPEAMKRLDRYLKFIDSAPPIRQMQPGLASTTMQQWEQALARANDVLNTLGTTLLSTLNPAFGALANSLEKFNDFLKAHPGAATGIATAGGVLGIGGALGLGAGALRLLGVGGGAAAAATATGGAALEGAAAGIVARGALGGIVAAIGGVLSSPVVIAALVAGVVAYLGYSAFHSTGPFTPGLLPRPEEAPPGSIGPDAYSPLDPVWHLPGATARPGRRSGPIMPAPVALPSGPDLSSGRVSPSAPPAAPVAPRIPPTGPIFGPPIDPSKHSSVAQPTVTIASLTINGAPHDSDRMWVDRIMGKIASRMADIQNNNLGSGRGTLASIYTSGGGMA